MTSNWIDRFWARIIKSDYCWIWIGARSRSKYDQYGKVNINGKIYRTHRVSFSLSKGIPLDFDGQVLHSCDNQRCCNPEHLRLGTHQDNMTDMKIRGRNKGKTCQIGELNHNAKLTATNVTSIKEMIGNGLNNKVIAAQFGVTHHTISCIRRGITW